MKTLLTVFFVLVVSFSVAPAFAQDAGTDLYQQARKLADSRKFKEAIEVYKQAIQQNPKHALLYNDLAWASSN